MQHRALREVVADHRRVSQLEVVGLPIVQLPAAPAVRKLGHLGLCARVVRLVNRSDPLRPAVGETAARCARLERLQSDAGPCGRPQATVPRDVAEALCRAPGAAASAGVEPRWAAHSHLSLVRASNGSARIM